MRLIKYTLGTLSGFGFLALLASAGACDAGTITFGQSIIQSVISLAVFILSACLAMYLDTKEKEKKRNEHYNH